MKRTIYNNIKGHILLLIKKAPKKNFVYPHLCYTEKWVLQLNRNASFILRIAALIHDIDRAFIKKRMKEKNMIGSYQNYKLKHVKNALVIANDVLKKFKITRKEAQKILSLIKHHEFGVHNLQHTDNKALQVLKDADALAFFEEINRYSKMWGKKATENKVNYTWARLSNKGKILAAKRFFKKLGKLGIKVPGKA